MTTSVLEFDVTSTSSNVAGVTGVFAAVSAVEGAATLPCHQEDPEVFFAETPCEINVAKALCTACPVMAECLAGALERREPWGVWGGQLFQQGVVIAQKRPRGRPRKNPVAA